MVGIVTSNTGGNHISSRKPSYALAVVVQKVGNFIGSDFWKILSSLS